jgi:hypothetical protein
VSPRSITCDNSIEQDTKAPDIAHQPRIFLFGPTLGWAVKWRSAERCHHPILLDEAAQPEVCNLDGGETVNEDVLGLQVAVRDTQRMAICNRIADLPEDQSTQWFIESVVLKDVIEELAARAQVDHEIEIRLVPEEVM